jgi:hypothetical protein
MTNSDYVARSIVRKFLSAYARPSTLAELLESIGDEEPTNKRWFDLIQDVHTDLTGHPADIQE